MNDDNVDYTFYDRPKFLSPKAQPIDKLGGIDESSSERIEPGDKLLSSIASRLSSKKSKRSIFDLPVYGKTSKRTSPKRRGSKRVSPKRKGNKSPKRKRRSNRKH
jgi:hypothetical protein